MFCFLVIIISESTSALGSSGDGDFGRSGAEQLPDVVLSGFASRCHAVVLLSSEGWVGNPVVEIGSFQPFFPLKSVYQSFVVNPLGTLIVRPANKTPVAVSVVLSSTVTNIHQHNRLLP